MPSGIVLQGCVWGALAFFFESLKFLFGKKNLPYLSPSDRTESLCRLWDRRIACNTRHSLHQDLSMVNQNFRVKFCYRIYLHAAPRQDCLQDSHTARNRECEEGTLAEWSGCRVPQEDTRDEEV